MKVRLVLEYDGTGFHGWQAQPGGQRTVAGELAAAVHALTGETVKLAAAGRTDAGAHSLGQTVSFDLAADIEMGRLREGLNGILPGDVAVVSAEVAEAGFHARFSARRRHYLYLVENRQARPALLRHRAWWVARPLDLDAMRDAAGALTGKHDLAAFGTDPAGRNTVRTLESVTVRRAAGAILAFELSADAFLYGMVRRIVGFLVEVGLGRRPASEAQGLLSGLAPVRARVAPAAGLYQLRVDY